MNRDASELVSMPVIVTDEGREVGRVRDVLFDPDEQSLFGLMVSSNDAEGNLFVPRDEVLGWGTEAITVERPEALQPFANQPRAEEIVASGIHLRGVKAITESGDTLGTIDKVLIDDDGNIACYAASKGFLGFGEKAEIRPQDVVTVGQDAIIVSVSAPEASEAQAGDDTQTQEPMRAETTRPDMTPSETTRPGATRAVPREPADESMER